MSLRIIYGKSGTGKSEYIFKEIKQKINTAEKIYIITPDQFSFTAEKKLLGLAESSLNAEVLTFNRMAYRVFNEIYGAAEVNLSKTGRAMILYNILLEQKNNLTFLKNSECDVDLLSNTITEFKKHNVLEKNLKESIENIKSEYLKAKLKDLYLIYSEYNKKISGEYIDENDKLTLLSQRIDESKIFNNSTIYIDEFAGFTKQEYSIIEKLLKKAKQVTFTICSNSLVSTENPENDIFYYNKQTAINLKNIALENNIKIENDIFLSSKYRFKTKELLHLEQNIYSIPYQKYDEEPKNIYLTLCDNPYNEIENVAKNIIRLVRDEKYKFKDIAIITKDLNPYSSSIKAIFGSFEIPVFIDEKKSLNQNPIIKYIFSILDIFSKNWNYESMFNYIKSGFLNLSESEIYKLDNYCKKWGIKGNKWFKDDWKWGEENLENLNNLRKQIINPLLNLKENLSKIKTCEKFCEELYNFCINENLVEKIENKQELQKIFSSGNEELKQAFNIVLKILDEMVLVFENEKMSFDKFKNLLKIAMQKETIGEIPMYIDEVIVGDIERTRSHKVKAIFMIGVNDGSFLNGKMEEGFLNNEDRNLLKQNEIELAKNTIERLYEEQFNVYKAFTLAEEKIFISYVSSDRDGNSKRPSVIISKIKKIFPKLIEKNEILNRALSIINAQSTFEELLNKLKDGIKLDKTWEEIFNWYKNNEIWNFKLQKAIDGLNYTNLPQKVDEKNLNKLYGKKFETSISKLEQYRKCPFSFHLKYGLKLKEENDFKIRALDTGSFMHETIDAFFEIAFLRGVKIKEIDENEICSIVTEIIEDKLKINKNYIYTSTPKFIVLTNKLKDVIIKSIGYIIWQIKQSDFDIAGTEIEFKKGSKYPPIEICLKDGTKVELTGKIDRLDTAKTENEEYLRIIDYKSSLKRIDLNEVIAGIQIQLIMYLDAITEINNDIPAGMFYFNLINPIIHSNKNKTNEEIEKEIRKSFKMQGIIIANIDIIKKMDKNLDKGYSEIIPAYIDKEGKISEKTGNVLNKEEFEALQEYGKKLVKEIAEEIISGDISIRPYYNKKNKKSPCTFCEYRNICGFNTALSGNNYRFISDLEKKEIFEKIINLKENKD